MEKANGGRFGRISFVVLSICFILTLLIQVFFAGLAIFIHPNHWITHTNFVHFFEWLPILMLIAAFIGKMPRWAKWQSFGLFVLIFLMYFTAHSHAIISLKYSAALHPVIAMIIFILSVSITQRSYQLLKQKQ